MHIGVVTALQGEMSPLARALQVGPSARLAEGRMAEASAGPVRLSLTVSGVGKVNASMATQRLIDGGVDLVLNVGVAAGVSPEVEVGDVVISSAFVQHDFDATPLTPRVGVVPLRFHMGRNGPRFRAVREFPADRRLSRAFLKAFPKASLKVVHRTRPRAFLGVIASGDQFIKDLARAEWIHREFGALCVEMEGAAVAQVCLRNRVPVVGVRAISDKGGGTAAEDFAVFFRRACSNLASLVLAYLETLNTRR